LLIERDAELAQLQEAMARAREGAGGVLVIEGPLGSGKSRLITAAVDLAHHAGLRAQRATGRELERSFPLGVALQLFEPCWRDDDAAGRARLFRGPAGAVQALADGTIPMGGLSGPGDWFGVVHGLLSLTLNLTAPDDDGRRQPLALLVDDVDRADAPSLLFLAYLVSRIAELPIAVVVSVRAGAAATDPEALDALRRAATGVLRPGDLSQAAVMKLVAAEAPGITPAIARECARLTGGNPFLVAELTAALRQLGPLAKPARAAVREVVPDTIAPIIRAQLAAMGPSAVALASALAVADEGQPLARVAALSGLEIEEAARCADALAAAQLCGPGELLSFRHPLIGAAIRQSIPEFERTLLQDRAARSAAPPFREPPAADRLTQSPRSPTPAGSLEPADRAIQEARHGEPRGRVRALAQAAWDDGELLRDAAAGAPVATALAGALLYVDELELGLDILSNARRRAGRRPDGDTSAEATGVTAWSRYHQGAAAAAAAAAQEALSADQEPDRGETAQLSAVSAVSLIQIGQLGEAEATLAMLAPEQIAQTDLPVVLDVRAQLRLAQRRPAEALVDALEAGRRAAALSPPLHPGIVAWRSTAALARLGLDEASGAQQLAEEELELARRIDLPRVTLRALRVLAQATTGRRRLDLLAEAVAVGESHPPRLEYLQALVEFGAATRRANRRAAAREPLSRAVTLSRQLGASVLLRRAEQELAAGANQRRHPRDGGVSALTASERRVAVLAAQGSTTREMAAELFVTPKTVEFHLRHVYRKLGIPSTRAELARAMRTDAPPEPAPE
jgi:DNA-binding CsgD family transcriptional regulator